MCLSCSNLIPLVMIRQSVNRSKNFDLSSNSGGLDESKVHLQDPSRVPFRERYITVFYALIKKQLARDPQTGEDVSYGKV